jgi:hypothetical protein
LVHDIMPGTEEQLLKEMTATRLWPNIRFLYREFSAYNSLVHLKLWT